MAARENQVIENVEVTRAAPRVGREVKKDVKNEGITPEQIDSKLVIKLT